MSARLALIIANTEYNDPGLAQLSAPGKDAKDFARVLNDQSICAFDKVNVLLNQSEPVIREAIDEFFDQRKPDDLLVLYFSGHGVRDELGALYLAVKNTIRNRLRSTAIKSDYIREAMDQSRSRRQVLILDCCNSGAFTQGTKAATGVSIGTASAFEAGYGRIILTASDSTQYAWEGNKVIGETDNSLFTHFLVEGLEGNADIDSDGRITVDELYDYAYEKVKLATPNQTPSKFSSKQQGEIVLRQTIPVEDIRPIALPAELMEEIEDLRPYVREIAVQKLEKILAGKNIGIARSAREALERLATEDDSRRVSQAATRILESVRQAEEEQKAKEEADRIARQKAEAEQAAREKAERERLAREKAESERLARQKTEREQLVQQKAENERLAREQAAREKAEREAAKKAAREQAEREKARREAITKTDREAKQKEARAEAEKRRQRYMELLHKTAHTIMLYYLRILLIAIPIILIVLAVIFTPSLSLSLFKSTPTPASTPTRALVPTNKPPTSTSVPRPTRTLIPTSAPITLPFELILSFDKDGGKNGLDLITSGDSDTEIVLFGFLSSQARRTGNNKALPATDRNLNRDSYIQFNVDDKIMYGGKPTTFVLIQIEYFDEGYDKFQIEYDAMGTSGPFKDGRFTETCQIAKKNTLSFKKAIFAIKNARFTNRDNGADFRISDLTDGAETIRLVRVLLLDSLDIINSDSCGAVK